MSPEALNTKPKDAVVVTFKNGKMRGLLHAGIKVAVFLFVVPATAPRGRVIDCTAKNTHVP